MDSKDVKMEEDHSAAVDALLPKIDQEKDVDRALESLMALEKQTRGSADMLSTGRLLVRMVQLLKDAKRWPQLNETMTAMSKKRGQLKQAIVKMIDEAILYLNATPDKDTKIALIQNIRSVTDGKIFVELQRARVTRILADMREHEGKVDEAADILQELQIETFGSMEKREKTDFFLEQMRLCLQKGDQLRAMIISRKIGTKFFADEANTDLKLRFYELMIKLGSLEGRFLDVCTYYRHVFDTKTIKEDDAKWPLILSNIVLYGILAPYSNEQADIMHNIRAEPLLIKLPLFNNLTKSFTTLEIMRWPKVEEIYKAELQKTAVFSDSKRKDSDDRWAVFHKRIVQHNIRVISHHYTKISSQKLAELLDLGQDEMEEFVSDLVVQGVIQAKINRPARTINFKQNVERAEFLQFWRSDVNGLLDNVVRATHLIAREEVYSLFSSDDLINDVGLCYLLHPADDLFNHIVPSLDDALDTGIRVVASRSFLD